MLSFWWNDLIHNQELIRCNFHIHLKNHKGATLYAIENRCKCKGIVCFFERDLLFSNSESDKLHDALLRPSVNFKGSLNCELDLALKIMESNGCLSRSSF